MDQSLDIYTESLAKKKKKKKKKKMQVRYASSQAVIL